METIDFRCQVRFLHRQRLVPPFQVNQCAAQFLASLKKECGCSGSAGSSAVDGGANRCVVRLSERRGLRIVSHKRDEGFSESDSEHSETYGQSHLAAGDQDRGSSGVNSSSSDIEEADWTASSSASRASRSALAGVRIECRLADILSCQNPVALNRVVLFTLRCGDTLDIAAVECGTQETARILTHLCQNICISASKSETLKRPASVHEKKTPIVSIQPWSQRIGAERNSDDEWSQWERANGSTPTQTPIGKTLDMARRLERQTSWNLIQRTDPSGVTHLQVATERQKESAAQAASKSTPMAADVASDKGKGSHRSVRSYLSAQSSPSPSASSAASSERETKAQEAKTRAGLKNRADSCIVSLQTPDMPLPASAGSVASGGSAASAAAAAAPSRRESQRHAAAKKEKLTKSQSSPAAAPTGGAQDEVDSSAAVRKPSKLTSGWLNQELEAVLQAQLAERGKERERGRQRERHADWGAYDTQKKRSQRLRSPTAGQAAAPSAAPSTAPSVAPSAAPAPSGSTKIKRDKSKTRSFLFKLTSSGDKADKGQPQSQEGGEEPTRKERGRSLLRRSAAMIRAPSQPPPQPSGQNTYLIPTKSGELSRSLYPKDLNYANGLSGLSGLAQQPHPIFLTPGHAAFPVRLTYAPAGSAAPGRGFHSMQMAPVYWADLLSCQDANNNSSNHGNHNNGGAPSQLLFYQPVADLKRIRSRSQSPGRSLIKSHPAHPVAYDGRGYVSPYPQQQPPPPQQQQQQPISLPSTMSAPWLTIPATKKSGDNGAGSNNSNSSCKASQLGRSRSRGAGSSRRRSGRQEADTSAAAAAAASSSADSGDAGRKVTFNAFATVQLVD